MTNETKIQPSLTPEEWAKGSADRGLYGVDWQRHPDSPIALFIADASETTSVDRPALPALIALANAALPDDSPYKMTQQDVRCLEIAAQSALDYGDQVIRIAAKLAALLPPEVTG